jgi:predicted transcriptional regulator
MLATMTLEAALLTAVSFLTGALGIFAKYFWIKAVKCEVDRDEMRSQLMELSSSVGRLEGRAHLVEELSPKIDEIQSLSREIRSERVEVAKTFLKLNDTLDKIISSKQDAPL